MLSSPHSPLPTPHSPRSAFTLIEMLVAVAITMIMMLAITQIFLYLGDNMDKGRAIIEMSGQLRNVSHRLQEDLDGLTASTLPWTKPDAGDGYFEYIEGARSDRDTNGDGTPDLTDLDGNLTTELAMLGDVDDVIAFTARSKGKPFVGADLRDHDGNPATAMQKVVVESELAEIVWWVHDDGTGNRTLNRRVLLIRPDLAIDEVVPLTTTDKTLISCRFTGTTWVANTLADLTLRQNRTLRVTNAGAPAAFPHALNTSPTILIPDASGSETVLSSVVAFDVKAWDPLAPLMNGALSTLVPGDPGYSATAATTAPNPTGRGAYVDLNYAGTRATSFYSGLPNSQPSHVTNPGVLTIPTFSTWPLYYEQDDVDQDGIHGKDQGTNGFDTPIDRVNNGTQLPPPDGTIDTVPPQVLVADDPAEYETVPPYPHPIAGFKAPGLRGVQVRIRLVETGSRQVRQSTVVGEFLPE